jgi:hypothetical protein
LGFTIVVTQILQKIRAEIETVSNGDPSLKFALRRRIYKQLEYDEQSNPSAREKLKKLMWLRQNRACAFCPEPLQLKDSSRHLWAMNLLSF